MPVRRFGQHHRLGAGVVAAGTAFHQIGRQREGRAGETDQRHLAQRVDQQRDRPANRLNRLWVKRFHGIDIGGGAHRVRDHRSDVGHDVQVDAGRAQRHDDVGEEDRRVDVVAADRLQGDLAGHFGLETGRQHAVPFAQRPVFGQRTAGLPHEPHRYAARFAAGDRGQIGRLGKVATSTH